VAIIRDPASKKIPRFSCEKFEIVLWPASIFQPYSYHLINRNALKIVAKIRHLKQTPTGTTMRRSRSSPKRQSADKSSKGVKAVSAGSSPPFYGSWASSVDYIKSLQTLSSRLESMELPNVASSYSQKIASEKCRVPKDFFEHSLQNDETESKCFAASTSSVTDFLAHALSGSSRHDNHSQARRQMPRSPYDSRDCPKTTVERRRISHSPPSVVNQTPPSPPSSAFENSGGGTSLQSTHDNQELQTYELEMDPVEFIYSAKSGSRPSSSNFSRNFSASECSMFYSPSRCSGLSSSTNRSTESNFKLPSVCMMSDYSAENFQNRRLSVSSRLRRLKHTDYDLSKSNKELFIATNGANRSCLLASQKQHSNLRSACPPGTVIAKDDLGKYSRLRNCDPNLASRELGLALHTTIHVQKAMRKQHGDFGE
jgi:hypothetical protein